MNLHATIWRFVIFFSFSINCLLPGECKRPSRCGHLVVEPAPPFILGSNLTVYCNIAKCQQRQEWSTISLELNSKPVAQKKVGSTTTVFSLLNVRMPVSTVRCVLQGELWNEVVSGMNLQGGLPPDKPETIICETSRSSDFINCTWEKGQETHVPTVYNISVKRENGTQMQLDQIQDKEVTIPRALMDEDAKYQLIITAYNHFGASQSDPVIVCVKDIVIPETPHIMQIKFGMDSVRALLQWKTNDSSECLRSYVRLRTDNGSWEAGETTELSDDLIQVDNLTFLTEYEFQLTTCNSTSGQTSTPGFIPRSATRKRSYCSKWSPSVRARSPGKGPSEQLHVWRMLGRQGPNGPRVVTVLWKPPSPEDYSGEVRQYKIFLGNDRKQNMTCGAALSRFLVQMPAEVQALSISAVTSYGASPPADVPLRHSGEAGPVLRVLAPVADHSSVLVSWSWPRNKHWSAPGGDLLYYVLEWTSVPVTELQWQKLAKDQNRTSITGLTAGVRYNISLCAVTTRGVSVPSSHLIYSKEQKPASGPNVSVLVHEARRIWIQWEEVPVIQLQGFITNYTIYLQTLDSSNTETSVTVPGSDPRQKWLDCPEAGLALQMSASTSEGEGPLGNLISFQPATPAVGPVIVIVFIFTIFIAIIANLMCCSCVKKRIKQKCVSWRPAWLDENLPKPGNSIAIRLLEQGGSEPTFASTYSNPPLSPITLISQEERNDMYPNVQVEMSHVGSGQPISETPLLMSEPGTSLVGSQVEHVSYKPQIATWAPHEDEVMESEEEQGDMLSGEEDRCSSVSGGLFGGFLSGVKVGFSDSHLGLTLSSGSGPLWLKAPEASIFNGRFLLGSRLTEDDVEADSQQGEIITCDTTETCLSQLTVAATLTDGYFPQAAAVSSTTVCDTQT